MTERNHFRARKSVIVCPMPKCNGESDIDETRRQQAWYVHRVRSCKVCGHVWSTAEIPLQMVKRVQKLDTFLKTISRHDD